MTWSVRPTRSTLSEASIEVPHLGIRLSDIEHPIVLKAQAVPLEIRAGKAKRIVTLTDRVWFKVKTRDWRGAAGNVKSHIQGEAEARLAQFQQWWWLGGVGHRQADSAQHDYYIQTTAKAHAGGRNSCDTAFLLPVGWDLDRLEAEGALVAKRAVQQLVRAAAVVSIQTSSISGFEVGAADVRVRVRMLDDGQVYVAVGATGIADANFYALLFTAIPGIELGEWLPEPGGPLSIEPASGEILYSAIMTPESQQELLNIHAKEVAENEELEGDEF